MGGGWLSEAAAVFVGVVLAVWVIVLWRANVAGERERDQLLRQDERAMAANAKLAKRLHDAETFIAGVKLGQRTVRPASHRVLSAPEGKRGAPRHADQPTEVMSHIP